MSFIICEKCGAHLDHGEKCDCSKEEIIVQGTELVQTGEDIASVEEKSFIRLEQLPIITASLLELSQSIDSKIKAAKSLVVTPSSKQTAKDLRASLSEECKNNETLRIQIKNKIMEPYNKFNTEYERLIKGKYNAAKLSLDAKILEIEDREILEKTDELKTYFEEYRQSLNIDFITYERAAFKVNLSTTSTALKKQAKEWLDKIVSDLALIDTQENKAEILVEYKGNLNCSAAITTVTARHKAIDQERQRAAEQEAAKQAEAAVVKMVDDVVPQVAHVPIADKPLTAPITQTLTTDESVYTMSFKVIATIPKLKELKQYLNDGGYKYDTI